MPQGGSNSVFERVFIENVQLFVRTVAKSPPPVLPQIVSISASCN